MSDASNDDSHLRATEAQMRRALGLHDPAAPNPGPNPPGATPIGAPRMARRFVRDGEVPISAFHRDDAAAGTNQRETAREALRTETASREHAERLLSEAHKTIRDLETKLAHEQIAREEAVQRAETGRQAGEQALAALREELLSERARRQLAEAELVTAGERLADAALRRRPAKAATPTMPGDTSAKPGRGRPPGRKTLSPPPAAAKQSDAKRPAPARQPKASEEADKPVEWWKPGWQKRFR